MHKWSWGTQVVEGDAKSVTAMLVDDVSGSLWLGHADGRVSAYPVQCDGLSISGARKYFWMVGLRLYI